MSEIRANTVSDAAGTGPSTLTGQAPPKAVCRFNQILVTLGYILNVGSVTDTATGIFNVNYNNNFADGDNAVVCGNGAAVSGSTNISSGVNAVASTDCTIYVENASGTDTDRDRNFTATYGDLA